MLLDFCDGNLYADSEEFPSRIVLQIYGNSTFTAGCTAHEEGYGARLQVDHPEASTIFRIELLPSNLGLDDSGWDEHVVRLHGLTWRGDGTVPPDQAMLHALIVQVTLLNGPAVSAEIRAWFPEDVGPNFNPNILFPTILHLDWDRNGVPLGEEILSVGHTTQAAMPPEPDLSEFFSDYSAYATVNVNTEMPSPSFEGFTSRPMTGFSLLPGRPTKPEPEDKGAPRYERDLDL